MRVRRIDEEGDWLFGQGRGNYAAAGESVRQRVCTRLRSFEGDWFLDLKHGLPWFERMARPADLVALEADLKRCVLLTEGVSEILDFHLALDPRERRLKIAISLRDRYGGTQSAEIFR
ncbi:hypothetical protein ABZR71_06325 [Pseudomonas paraeruginosa]|uniref:hypothetical protein n=1 Tax=Pseudomonas aeruginosa group TaxID=136841 RepID=UPI0005B91F0B|nr:MULTISPECIES: hypothetical protein [Pseudomonas aeruginosa group]KSF81322.1 hypothetical protein AO940_06365 [Pseudomonas aeruginosa]MCR3766594.1 hypothetical protein [Pseudomonas aeruginosa]MDK2347972.1 hypothetical protein [Pseudomonas paraeruginosa]MEA8481340.1 hypothetical protein [Pseudomonas aeruginosa]PTC35610.1 phage-related protein [Pseudomonas aeruginosa]